MNEDLIQRFGFSEMYEWDELPEPNCRLGRFVTFSEKNPDKIRLVKGSNENILGISTVNSVIDSDDPAEWKYKNMCNEYGDTYLRKEKLAVGQKVYDQLNEMNYIQTRPWEHFIPIENQYYNKDAQYIPRTKRVEWIRVNLIGKAVVEDNGKCEAGKYCTPYTGKLKEKQGTAIPAEKNGKNTFYVICRLSEKTILVLNK
jgi:hypothetical protein